MYVCLCNAYSDKDLKAAVDAGYRTVQAAYESLGNGPCCGQCVPFAQSLIDETTGATQAAPAVPLMPQPAMALAAE